MAKTFKNLSAAGESASLKPVSEQDFFDLTDNSASVQNSDTKTIVIKNKSKIDNTSNIGNKSNITRAAKVGARTPVTTVEADDAAEGVRQTFVLARGHLEQLRDFVHARRSKGDYTYSQKQALQDALDLLFAAGAPAAPRPAQARELEQQRRERIQKGRQVKGSE